MSNGHRVVTVEPDARLLPVLRRNVEHNAPNADVTVVHAAIDYSGRVVASLRIGKTNLSGEVVSPESPGGVEVPSITLSGIKSRYGIGRYVLVADIEGTEAAILRKDADSLVDCDMAIIELHAAAVDGVGMQVDDLAAEFTALGFRQVARRHDVFVFSR